MNCQKQDRKTVKLLKNSRYDRKSQSRKSLYSYKKLGLNCEFNDKIRKVCYDNVDKRFCSKDLTLVDQKFSTSKVVG